MNGTEEFVHGARQRYVAANQAALRWQLARMDAASPVIDTKLNSITLENYNSHDGLRGKDYVYGWIQGRGLEALVLHADYFQSVDPDLSRQLTDKARALYGWLNILYESRQGAHFCYNANLEPVCVSDISGETLQRRDPSIATFSDLFVVKGLIAASARYFTSDLPRHLRAFQSIIDAIDNQRFQQSESSHISEQALLEQGVDYGPQMIALGAAALLNRLGLAEHDQFSQRFIKRIFDDHYHADSGLLSTVKGEDICNIGHSLEFAGFSLEAYRLAMRNSKEPELDRLPQFIQLIKTAFEHGFNEVGLHLNVTISTGAPASTVCPWWSLPETIRAASLAYEFSTERDDVDSAALLAIWQKSHDAFYQHYWRDDPPIAYQTMTIDGPVDYVPATPDLDPGYHTGLSLLAAIESVDRCSRSSLPS